jgi:glycosyltransferase involved in cell wall biosynthesis
LLTLEKDQRVLEKPKREEIAEKLKQEGIHWLPFAYKPFGVAAFVLWIGISLKLCSVIIQRKISVIHCWCTPPGAIGYFLSVLLNKKLVLDSYEPHAEAMVENRTWKRESLAFKLLFWLEKKQTERASYIISATEGMKEYAARKYHVDIQQFFVKPACVDMSLFNEDVINDQQLRHQLVLENKIVCVYAGKFGGIYMEDEVFDFIKVAHDYWGDAFRFLILTNHTQEQVRKYCERAQLDFESVIIRYVAHQNVPQFMGLADFALTPVKPIPTKRYCTPIKDGEYWALGLPVVIPAHISDDSEIIEQNNIGSILKEFNQDAYRVAVENINVLLKHPDIRIKIRNVAKRYRSFEIAEKVYKQVYPTEL